MDNLLIIRPRDNARTLQKKNKKKFEVRCYTALLKVQLEKSCKFWILFFIPLASTNYQGLIVLHL